MALPGCNDMCFRSLRWRFAFQGVIKLPVGLSMSVRCEKSTRKPVIIGREVKVDQCFSTTK